MRGKKVTVGCRRCLSSWWCTNNVVVAVSLSPFVVRRSSFVVRRSSFVVRRRCHRCRRRRRRRRGCVLPFGFGFVAVSQCPSVLLPLCSAASGCDGVRLVALSRKVISWVGRAATQVVRLVVRAVCRHRCAGIGYAVALVGPSLTTVKGCGCGSLRKVCMSLIGLVLERFLTCWPPIVCNRDHTLAAHACWHC